MSRDRSKIYQLPSSTWTLEQIVDHIKSTAHAEWLSMPCQNAILILREAGKVPDIIMPFEQQLDEAIYCADYAHKKMWYQNFTSDDGGC